MQSKLVHIILFVICLLVISGGQAFAQLNGGSHQIVSTFDFEERDIHFEDIPMFWEKVTGREGFPHYSSGRISSDRKRSGEYSFKLISDGGSIGFEYARRRQVVKPGSDCQVTGFVSLANARDCRAQISCFLTDRLGREIPGSRRLSKLISPADFAGQEWLRVDVYIPGEFPDARFISVGLWLLQKSQWDKSMIGTNVFEQNINAVAWFDDIGIFQLPRVLLKTDQVANVFPAHIEPCVKVELQSAGILDYRANLVITDRENQQIFSESWVLSGIEGEVKVRNLYPGNLPAGLYNTKLEIYSSNILIAVREMKFATLAPLQSGDLEGGYDFGVITMDDFSGTMDEIISLSKNLQTKIIKMPVWRTQDSLCPSILNVTDFDRKLIDLEESRIRLVATFDEVSSDVMSGMDMAGSGLLDVLSQDSKVWQDEIDFILARYALQIPFWQIGPDQNKEMRWDPRIKPVTEKLRDEFNKVVRNTKLSVPLEATNNLNFNDVGTRSITMFVPSAIQPRAIPDYIQTFKSNGLSDVWVTVEPLDARIYREDDMLIDFFKRLIYSVKADCEAVFIPHPWRKREVNANRDIEVDEKFLVFRTISDILSGAVMLGEFQLSHQVPALLFDRNGRGVMVVWDENYDDMAANAPSEFELYLGNRPRTTDMFGNTSYLDLKGEKSVLKLTNWPQIITGIDTEITLLRSTVELEPDVLDASVFSQKTKLRFSNPFKTTIMGQAKVLLDDVSQENWLVEPQSFSIMLKPDQVFETDLKIKFPSSEISGKKLIKLGFRVDADQSYFINVAVPFTIEMKDIDARVFARRVNDTDMYVQMILTNNGTENYSLRTFILLPDGDYDEKSARLEPDTTITRAFLVKDAVQWIGRYVRVGLRDPKGDKRINYQLKIQ